MLDFLLSLAMELVLSGYISNGCADQCWNTFSYFLIRRWPVDAVVVGMHTSYVWRYHWHVLSSSRSNKQIQFKQFIHSRLTSRVVIAFIWYDLQCTWRRCSRTMINRRPPLKWRVGTNVQIAHIPIHRHSIVQETVCTRASFTPIANQIQCNVRLLC